MKMKSSRLLHLLTAASLLAACAGRPTASTKPAASLLPELPYGNIPMDTEPLYLEQAERLIARIEAEWPDDPLMEPESLEDVETILKLDQTNLFPAGLELAKKDDSLEAQALAAQIELAWGESYTVLMETLLLLGRQVDRIAMSMQQAISLEPEEEAALDRLNELSDRIARVVELFQILSLDHIAEGAKIAQQVIEAHPDSYLGYRVAADHKRLLREWDDFDFMMAKIEAINPESNGLIFQKGAEALQRKADSEAAIDYYSTALANDPRFVRAQAHLVMAQPDLAGMIREYQKLKQLNPNHQMVYWMDAAIEIARRRGR